METSPIYQQFSMQRLGELVACVSNKLELGESMLQRLVVSLVMVNNG